MLTPLKRQKFDLLIPTVPTADQYQYYWGTSQDVFRRVLISVALLVVFSLLYNRTQENSPNSFAGLLMFVCAGLGGLYWLLGPVASAMRRNGKLRRFAYVAFWEAKVTDVYLSEEVLSKQESIDDRGRLEVIHNTESFLNVELGDRTGFATTLRVPMQRQYKRIQPRHTVCMLLLSNDPNFNRISKITSDAYIPQINLWISDYPYLSRDAFVSLTRYMFSRNKPIIEVNRN
ncbi:hypothetical protein [Pseudanabaena sp. PCC 6802]|uniref:hypothetical protein n=1 Tax=Pseudanabaena sp. PCC 6802 TaxID=118173 RepID=UPI0003484A06|nr:hypothetical protein [Pseudanabaena sp. PCC 6802]